MSTFRVDWILKGAALPGGWKSKSKGFDTRAEAIAAASAALPEYCSKVDVIDFSEGGYIGKCIATRKRHGALVER